MASTEPRILWKNLSIEVKRTTFALALAFAFLATHLPFVSPGPESVDATNFALGVRNFDVSDHRPHPPGYPVFIALGKITRSVVPTGPLDSDTVRKESRALGIWSALFGAIAVFPLLVFLRSLEHNDRRAAWATLLAMVCPLFWFTAVRSISDIPGLVAACMAQAILFTAHRRQQSTQRPSWRLLLLGAMLSGFVIGLRSQTMWVTLPVLIAVTFLHTRQLATGRGRSLALVGIAFAAGIALWAVPLLAVSGGPSSYISSFKAQATLDLADADLLIRQPSIGRLMVGVINTFGYPWANKYLAGAVVLIAIVGFGVMARQSRAALGWLSVAYGPYLIFHLLFQDPAFSRYALPVIPAVAYLAVRGLERLSTRGLPALVGLLCAACLIVAEAPVMSFSAIGGAGYQAISAVRQALGHRTAVRPVLALHHEVGRALRGERVGTLQLPYPRSQEWLEVVKYWREGGSAPVWFLGDSSRTDLALIDPSARKLLGEFRLPFSNRFFMSGARPTGVDWYELADPSWMVGEGWALTPETAGVAWRSSHGPGFRPITAWIRRRSEPALMMIGGRNLGMQGEPDVRFEAAIDGRSIASWTVAPAPGFFLKSVDLPAGTLDGAGRYATLTIAARPADGVIRQVNAAVEQFDVQSITRPVFGFDAGWYQVEFDPKALKLWRWTGPWAVLRVHNAGRDLKLRLTGSSPLNYVDRIPTVTVRANDRILGRLSPTDDFVLDVPLPAAALASSHGEIVLESSVTFVPDDIFNNGDRRPLGLRIFDVSVR